MEVVPGDITLWTRTDRREVVLLIVPVFTRLSTLLGMDMVI